MAASTQKPLVNGETPSSKTISHITSYPVIHDSITFSKQQAIVQQSLSFLHNLQARFVDPLIPHLRGPYSYISPYVSRADDIGDSGLNSLDSHFPIVKEDTDKVKSTVFNYAFFPVRVALDGKGYLQKTWNEEYGKNKEQGVVGLVKAGLSTELRIAGDTYVTVLQYLQKGKEASEKKTGEVKEKINN